MSILDQIDTSSDVKKLNIDQLQCLSGDIRALIVKSVLQNGGHLSSNLGVVELVVGLHYVFDFPKDKLIFDVGHQCYTHKILTGRKEGFKRLRQSDGVSGFPKFQESEYDIANTGHASTSLSIACGLSRALTDSQIISILGDGAMTGGLICEALNDISFGCNKQIIIINDNKMSISENESYTSYFLSKLDNMSKSNSLNRIGVTYYGSINGHDFEQIIKALEFAKKSNKTVIIHAVTQKGRGYQPAEDDPVGYHGYSTSQSANSFSKVFGQKLCKMADENNNIWAITAAMKDGVGLNKFAQKYKDRFVDVGIAEAHAMTMASGLALGGKRPYFAVYSSFLQRAFDSLLHDICLNNLPVTVCIDRAGIVSNDGETHQGIYDVSFLRCMPNICIMQPKDYVELEDMLEFSQQCDCPVAIRYPKGESKLEFQTHLPIQMGKFEKLIYDKNNEVTLVAGGALMNEQAIQASEILSKNNISVNVINARFVKPLDYATLDEIKDTKIVVLEDNASCGGLWSAMLEYYDQTNSKVSLFAKNLGDNTYMQASTQEILKEHQLDAQSIACAVEKL